jgi:hypothetical protein
MLENTSLFTLNRVDTLVLQQSQWKSSSRQAWKGKENIFAYQLVMARERLIAH